MRILIINANDTEREFQRIYLENALGSPVIRLSSNIKSAAQTLTPESSYDAILWRDDGSEDIVAFSERLRREYPETILILHGPRRPEQIKGFMNFQKLNGYLADHLSPRDFCLELQKIIAPSRSNLERIPAFQKVRLVNFYRFNKVLCPVYLKLSDRKYVKVLNANTHYLKNEIDSYRQKGIDYFYIANSDFEKFKVTFTEQRFLELSPCGKENLDHIAATQILLHDLVKDIGISESAIDLANKNIEMVKDFIEDHPGLSQLFLKQHTKHSYLYDHGHLIAMVCCNIFQRLNWDTSDNIFKLCAAAVLHDLKIHSEELGEIESLDADQWQNYSKDELDKFLSHPEEMAKALEQQHTVPSEIIEMVRCHHENNDGTGFYRIPPSRLSKMSSTFIIAHRYINLMYHYEFLPEKHGEVLQKLRKEFTHQSFSTVLTAFDIPARQIKQKSAA